MALLMANLAGAKQGNAIFDPFSGTATLLRIASMAGTYLSHAGFGPPEEQWANMPFESAVMSGKNSSAVLALGGEISSTSISNSVERLASTNSAVEASTTSSTPRDTSR